MIGLVLAWSNLGHGWWWEEFLHPGNSGPHGGYWFYSGLAGAAFLGLIPATILLLRNHNCHEPHCPRIGRFLHQESGSRWCHRHLPQVLVDAHPKPEHLERWGHKRSREQA